MGLIYPLDRVYPLSSGYGLRTAPKQGASADHAGIDIAAPAGSAVYASAAGYAAVSYDKTRGTYVTITSADGRLKTIYQHLQSAMVNDGDQVQQGDQIGSVGSTGVSTGPHLHFGVSIDGTYVDPAAVLDEYGGSAENYISSAEGSDQTAAEATKGEKKIIIIGSAVIISLLIFG